MEDSEQQVITQLAEFNIDKIYFSLSPIRKSVTQI